MSKVRNNINIQMVLFILDYLLISGGDLVFIVIFISFPYCPGLLLYIFRKTKGLLKHRSVANAANVTMCTWQIRILRTRPVSLRVRFILENSAVHNLYQVPMKGDLSSLGCGWHAACFNIIMTLDDGFESHLWSVSLFFFYI